MTTTTTTFTSNPQLELAFDYIQNTNKNVFLTGKAGTGKTTFLHRIRKKAIKRMVVVAPTGVAAINAQGMTMHSFFQLPFGLYIPNSAADLSRQRKFSRKKRNLIKSLDLLIIDEISMVRADMLDAVDDVLRRYKDFSKPFGGVQLLMIGDLHQLPPVVKNEDWEQLREHYQTSYFFGSLALAQTQVINIELTHIYRQSDSIFINLLNKVRNNRLDQSVLQTLNSRYIANFQPNEDEGYITLTSHNATAKRINESKLNSISGNAHTFKAKVKGDFPKHAYPTDEILLIKKGAQVVFIKNDTAYEKRYYNGKIGTVVKIEDGAIFVRSSDWLEPIEVVPVDWENIKFNLNEKKEVEEEVIGTFKHYPLKLAWAITIHKSQGLTFEKAIIDAKSAFAHGQVYVALSRCKSFEGIVLLSKIGYSSVKTDLIVRRYSNDASKNPPTAADLEAAKRIYQQELIRELFSFGTLKREMNNVYRVLLENEHSFTMKPIEKYKLFAVNAEDRIFSIAQKFLPALERYFLQPVLPVEQEKLQGRIKKAHDYFTETIKLLKEELYKIPVVTDNKAIKEKAEQAIENLEKEFFRKYCCFVVSKEGFEVAKYIKAKTDSDLNFQKQVKKKAVKAKQLQVPDNVPHPELYAELLTWRDEIAEERGVKKYDILPTKSLLELVEYLPTGTAKLKRIRGIGPVKLRQFGKAIINIIEEYCVLHQISSNVLPIKNRKKFKKPKTQEITFDMFELGSSIEEIMKERGLVRSSIEGHLKHYIALGELNIFKVMKRYKVEEIEQYFIKHPKTSNSEAKEHFGKKYSYSEFRMVLAYMALRD